MSKKKQKRYVVRQGKQTGIFDNWPACQDSVHGFVGAQYKSFSSYDDAVQALSAGYDKYIGRKTDGKTYTTAQKKEIGLPVTSSISVDAACAGNPGLLEFRGVATDTQEILFASTPYPEGTVNIGEFLALVQGLRYAQKHRIPIIYSDSRTAMARAQKRKANTTLQPTDENTPLFIKLDEAERRIQSAEFMVQTRATHNDKHITPDQPTHIIKRETALRGEIPADYGRK